MCTYLTNPRKSSTKELPRAEAAVDNIKFHMGTSNAIAIFPRIFIPEAHSTFFNIQTNLPYHAILSSPFLLSFIFSSSHLFHFISNFPLFLRAPLFSLPAFFKVSFAPTFAFSIFQLFFSPSCLQYILFDISYFYLSFISTTVIIYYMYICRVGTRITSYFLQLRLRFDYHFRSVTFYYTTYIFRMDNT